MLDSLLHKFKKDFQSHSSSHLKNVFVLLLCIIDKETVNLYKLKKHVPRLVGNSRSRPYAHYKRLLRTIYTASQGDLWKLLLQSVMGLFSHQVKYLVLDGTKWEIGTVKIHFLTLSIVYKGVSIPIYFQDLAKKGHSHTEERKAFIKAACQLYNLRGKILLADRAYQGKEWFAYLKKEQGIDFTIRLKKGTYQQVINACGGFRYSKMEKRAMKRKHGVSKAVTINGVACTFVIVKNKQPQATEPLLYLLSTLGNHHQISEGYALRWLIEVCFKHMKSNGFRLEEVAVKPGKRMRFMMALVIFAYAICIHEGLKHFKTVKKKKHKVYGEFPETSLFRTGVDYLVTKTTQIGLFLKYLWAEIQKMRNKYRSPKAILYQNVQ